MRFFQNIVFKQHKLKIVTQTPLTKHSYQTLKKIWGPQFSVLQFSMFKH